MLFLRLYFWIAPHAILAVLLFVFLRRGLQKQLPIFSTYLVFEISQFLVLLTINLLPSLSRPIYSRVYVFGLVLSTILKFGIIYELGTKLFASGSILSGTFRPLMHWVSGLLLILTTLASATLTQARLESIKDIFVTLELSTNVIFVALLLLLFFLARLFHISWQSYAAGIALGFGLFASLEVGTTALRANIAESGDIWIDVLQMIGYHISTLVWLVYVIWVPRSVRFDATGIQKSDLETWDQELQRMVQR
jgi:hypothetical protein